MKYLIHFFIIALLTGCGFHLRGNVSLNPHIKKIFLQTENPYGQLARHLRNAFNTSGITVTKTAQDADIILVILNEQQSEQQTNVSATQQTRQYTLISSINFTAQSPTHKTIIAPQTVSETRTVTTQSNTTLASSNEVTTLYQQMQAALVFDIMSRLTAHNANQQFNHYFKTQ